MESFEQFVAVAMQSEGLVVTGPFRFKIGYLNLTPDFKGKQDTPYEIDLIGASRERLVLATVKSFFGSQGARPKDVLGTGKDASHYRMINDPVISKGLVQAAADRFGYEVSQVEVRLYAGKYAGKTGEATIREWASDQILGGGPLQVFNIAEVVGSVRALAQISTYSDSAPITAMKAVAAAIDYERQEQKVNSSSQGAKVAGVARKWEAASREFPLSTLVRSVKDGFTGLVVGYTNQGTPNPYITIANPDSGVERRRAASTLEKI